MGRVQIRQLGGRRRTADFRGRSGCLSPVSIGIEQRGQASWAPLASEAVPLNLGGMPKPIEFTFRWHDRDLYGSHAPLIDGRAQTDSQLVIDAVYDMVADGQLVELIHEHRTMRGTLREFDGHMTRAGWVKAELRFEPQALRVKSAPRPGPEPEGTLARVRKLWGKVLTTATLPATLTSSAVDSVAQGVGAVNSAFRALDGAVAGYAQARRSVEALGLSVAAACQKLTTATRGLDDALDGSPTSLLGTDDASLWLDHADLRSRLGQGLRRMRQVALQERELQRQTSDARVMTRHLARDGDNLRAVAQAYWGAELAHLWQQIATFNQLEGAALRAGAIVLIPYPRGV